MDIPNDDTVRQAELEARVPAKAARLSHPKTGYRYRDSRGQVYVRFPDGSLRSEEKLREKHEAAQAAKGE